ncbi:MAG: hypothetical protein GF401_14745 [Chitinivibrionales bacterium]|nr:hypothetical protein [Chitinivibrionales bacterium]
MAKNRSIGSTKNQFKKKEDVVAGMNKKLASGKDVVKSFQKEVKARKTSAIIVYVTFYTLFLTIGFLTARYLHFESRETARKKVNKFVEPVKTMHAEFESDKIGPDQYARYLYYMLVHADRVPEKYKQGVPRFTRDEIYQKIRILWPMLYTDTRREILKELPKFSIEDTAKNAVETPPENESNASIER